MSAWRKILNYFIVICMLLACCPQREVVYAADGADTDGSEHDESCTCDEYALGMPAVIGDIDETAENDINEYYSYDTANDFLESTGSGSTVNYSTVINGLTVPFDDYQNNDLWKVRREKHTNGKYYDVYYDPILDKDIYLFSSTCMSFSHHVFYRLFGFVDRPSNKIDSEWVNNSSKYCDVTGAIPGSEITIDKLREIFNGDNIQPGANIRTGEKVGGGWGHNLIYIGHDNIYIYTYEGNYDGKDGVAVRRRTWRELKEYLTITKDGIKSIHMPNNYPLQCKHESVIEGECENCGKVLDNRDNPDTSYEGIYMPVIGKDASPRIKPYLTSEVSPQVCLFGEVSITGLVTNYDGDEWYKIKYGEFKNGSIVYTDRYVPEDELYIISDFPPQITFKSVTGPNTNHIYSNSFNMTGTLISDNCTIKSITAHVVDTNSGKDVIKYTDTPNTSKYTIYNHSLNYKMKFGTIPIGGKYEYYIEAFDSKDNRYESTRFPFYVVKDNSVDSPVITTSDFYGGKTVTIKCSTTGATINYKIGYLTGSSAGEVVLNLIETNAIEDIYIYAYASKDSKKSITISEVVYVGVAETPQMSSTPTVNGQKVVITSDTNTEVYYSINGGEDQRYWSPFELSSNARITAYAREKGCINSSTVSLDVVVEPPASPTIMSKPSDSKIAQGSPVTIGWLATEATVGYNVTVKLNGAEVVQEQITEGNSYTFNADSTGTYTTTVTAYNNIGSSVESNTISFEAMSPSTVTVLDYDDTLISEQIVDYNKDAVRPTAPTRTGYTFYGWDDSFKNITADCTIRAEYTINTYNVRFLNYNQSIVSSQYIEYKNSATQPTDPVYETEGFEFVGWRMVEGEGDINSVESDQVYEAVFQWANENLPVVTEIISAVRDDDTGDEYTIDVKLNNYLDESRRGKIVVNLKTAEGKMVATAMHYVSFNGAETPEEGQAVHPEVISETVTVLYKDAASIVDVVLVLVDENDKTGGAFAETVSSPITGSSWSEWQYDYPTGQMDIQTALEYRSRERDFFETTENPIDGDWELYNTVQNWEDWSSWSDTPITATTTREVETRRIQVTAEYKEYRYIKWESYNCSKGYWSHFCKTCAQYLYGGTWTLKYSPWSTATYSVDGTQYCSHCGYVNIVKIDGRSYYQRRDTPFDNTVRTIDATYKTQYRYRDSYNMYYYQQWGEFTPWQDEEITATTTLEVETREKYRYKSTVNPAGEDTSGVLYEISGRLTDNQDFSGEHAAVMVYQGSNVDPTQSQLQYAGGITINEDNRYSFSFKTKLDISEGTGDFIITLGLEGATNLINIDRIQAPVVQHTVKFIDYNGAVIDEQLVNEGLSAMLPETPQREGYEFSRWDKSFTCITQDINISAIYTPEEHAVVFVDWLNNTINLTEHLHGELLTTLDSPSFEGHIFLGWDAVLDGNTTVNDNMVVQACYQANVYSVEFLDQDGAVYNTQLVEYGNSAVLPEDIIVDNDKVFLGWDNESAWWNVTSDISVVPIVVYAENTMTPISSKGYVCFGTTDFIDLNTEEGAITYYTTDGSDPTALSSIYTEPIFVEEDTVIKAISIAEGKNYSDVVEVQFFYDESLLPTNYSDNIEVRSYDVVVKSNKDVKINVDISNNPGLFSYMFFIECDPNMFYIDYDPETDESNFELGIVSKNGTMYVEPWEDKGWQILWFGDETSSVDGSVFTLTLTACEGVTSGIYPLNVYYSSLGTLDSDLEAIDTLNAYAGILSMVIDINNDEMVDMLDLVIVASNYGTVDDGSDINYDAIVNLYDLIYISRYME